MQQEVAYCTRCTSTCLKATFPSLDLKQLLLKQTTCHAFVFVIPGYNEDDGKVHPYGVPVEFQPERSDSVGPA